MIQKAELRIGNYIKPIAAKKKYDLITGITEEGVHVTNGSTLSFNLIDPIQITEKILKQSGFLYGRKYCQTDFYDLTAVWKDNDEQVWAFKRNKEIIKYIKYLHEAQNIFFVLESKELQITA